ncbi:CHAT domain-containing protein [Streptomyces sp. NPDC058682]|uniref:CHAT domain-containing protein n=1 Tax=unclassified Streptomyces TaxID=2593676 RepID=UPI0022538A78|nr:CHAT domain-containing protein [Streptomyces sp. NBC_01214]MCX4804340.1 CHAT domain-containing protein [Streptomyces sp. NBC_01214]
MTADAWEHHSRQVDRRMALAREWDDLVEQVRAIDDFQDFLRPPPLESLLQAAEHGTVVVINISRWRCDALIVHSRGLETLPLPDLTADEVSRRVADYLRVLQDGLTTVPGTSFREAIEARRQALREREDVLRSTMEWLWDAVTGPVLDALRITGPPEAGKSPPRLWWCPTGLLTLLPLHGAGYHSAESGCAVVDRVVSSYTPTLRALNEASKPLQEHADRSRQLLFVGVPDVPDQLQLAQDVAREHDFLQARFPGGVRVLEGPDATMESVQAALSSHRWVHLSCHGQQNLNDPSAAGLVLSDGTLTVTRLSSTRYTGDFAFLSACRTAAGGLNLPDEAITLAAALNYTGYRHVVATLWSVDPAVAADVTAAVYPELIDEEGRFRPDRAAFAVHEAVRLLRAERRPLDDWLPFTHTGP